MAKRLKLTDRARASDAFIYSCRAFVAKDIDTAFLWAVRVLQSVNESNLHLTENEQLYISEVLKRKNRKNRKKST